MPTPTLPTWVRRFDWVLLAALLITAVVELTDGFSTRIFGMRFSMRSSSRLFIYLMIIVLVRYFAWRRFSFLENVEQRGWLTRDAAWPSPAWHTTIAEIVAVTGFFVVVVAGALYAQVLAPFSVPDYGDPLFSTWRMSWVTRTLFTDPVHLFQANVFYPEPNTLAYSDSIIVPAIFAAPLLWAGVPRIVVYHLVLLTAMISSGVTLYFLVSRLTSSRAAGLVSGTVFALYPFRFEHYSHLELQMTMWMAPALLMLHRLVADGRVRTGAAVGILMGLQLLSSLYFGIFFTLYLSVMFGALVLFARIRPVGTRVKALLVTAVLLAVAALPLLPPYFDNRARLGERSPAENVVYSAMPADYLAAHPRSMLYGGRLETGPPERCLFPGVTPVVLAVTALLPPFNTIRAAYGVALFFSFDATLGYNGELYPTLYRWLMPLRGLRVPARFSILVGFSLAILAGLAIGRLKPRLSPRQIHILAGVAVVLVIIEYRPALALQPVWRNLPPVYQPLIKPARSVVAVFPMSKEPSDNDAKYMYFSTWHWQRLVNGYSGNFPASYAELLGWMRGFPSAASIDYLRRRDVEYIVLHGEFERPVDYDRAIPILDANPHLELVGEFPGEPRPSRLYRVLPVAPHSQ